MAQTFRVVLTQDKRFDVYDTREFDLALDATFPIGRSSSNATKPHLMPAKHNAYIESPVVSRTHATLTADARSGLPRVYLTDTGSMHGTYVNGNQLAPNVPKPLSTGDKVQLGANVNRNDNYYQAYEYTFKADLSVPEHFPHGFSVPDSDDEDVGVLSSHWGSQENPMTFDDSDADSDVDSDVDSNADEDVDEDADENADEDADQDVDQDASSDHSDTPVDDNTLVEHIPLDDTTLVEHNTPHRFNIDELCCPGVGPVIDKRDCSDITGMNFGYDVGAEYEVTHSLNRLSGESDNELDLFPTSDVEVHSDSEDDGSMPADDHDSELSRVNVDEDETEDHFDAHLTKSQLQPQTLSPRVVSVIRDLPAQELPSFSALSQSLCCQPAAEISMPHPPLVISPENVMFEPDLPLDEAKPVEDPPANYAFMDSMADMGVPNVFSKAVPEASRMQTPPLGAMSDEASTTPPPGRRTGVSITEIIEQQPLTPTSVKGQKRKANVFDDEETMAVDVLAAPEVAASGSQVVNIDLRRPRRQPKSIMAKALKTASYLIPGAAVSFALLANLPDSFFGA